MMCLTTLHSFSSTVQAESSLPNFEHVKTWGGTGSDIPIDQVVDSSGNRFVIGTFAGTVDLDPGSGVSNHTSAGGSDMYLTKFDASGAYLWTKTWGGPGTEAPAYYDALVIGPDDKLYVSAYYSSTSIDLDPGPGVVTHTNNGGIDVLLFSLNADGVYQWSKSLGGTGSDVATGIIRDGSSLYVTGSFSATVDFDPSGGVDSRTSNGAQDAYLSKFTLNGDYVWTQAWGGTGIDQGTTVFVDRDHDVYVPGKFSATVDFDPSAGVDSRTSNGGDDINLSKFAQDGSWLWSKTIGGAGADLFHNLVQDSQGRLLISARITGSVDVDPGPGIDIRGTTGATMVLSVFDTDGIYQGAIDMPNADWPRLTLDSDDNLYLVAGFNNPVDFDPGEGVVERTSNGAHDAYVLKLNSELEYQWVVTFGGTAIEFINNAHVSNSGDVTVIGYFGTTVDFDFGPGVDPRNSAGGYDSFVLTISQTYKQNIISSSNLTVINAATGDNLSTIGEGSDRGEILTARLQHNGLPLADAQVTIGSNDLDWSTVTGSVDSDTYRSVISGLASAPGVSGPHTLYVPKADNHDRVTVCPNATTLGAVTSTCSNRRVLSVSDTKVSVVTIDGKSYWKVDGLTGTGGISLSAADVPGVPETGLLTQRPLGLLFAALLLVLLSVVGLRLKQVSR